MRNLFFVVLVAALAFQAGAADQSKDAKSKKARAKTAPVPKPSPTPEAAAPSAGFLPGEGNIAAGFIIGSIGALTAQYWISEEHAVDIGVEFLDHPWQVFYADYTYHFLQPFGKGTRFGRESSLFVGLGTGAGFWDRLDTCGRWNCQWTAGATGTGNGFFVRAPVGIEWYIGRTHIGITAEFAPSFLWYPSNGQTYDVALGSKYVF